MNSQQIEELQAYTQKLKEKCGSTGAGIVEVISELIQNTGPDKLINPADQDAISVSWCSVAHFFVTTGVPYQALAVYQHGLKQVYFHQRQIGNRFHKGTILHNTGVAYLAAGDKHTALWFYRLAFLEDVLSRASANDPIPEAPAAGVLRLFYGISDDVLKKWMEDAGCEKILNPDDSEQRLKLFYPEISVVKFACEGLIGPTQREAKFDIPINPILLDDLDKSLDAEDSNVRGRNLERLSAYLCLTLPGVFIRERLRTAQDEIDIIVIQRDSASSYFVESLGRTFLVECKNTTDPVGGVHINQFAAKIRLHGCKAGLLVATNSVSGTRTPGRGLSDGQLILQGWFHQDNIKICVITRQDIQRLIPGRNSFADLILSKLDELRFAYTPKDAG
jgi:hypothetical protein